MIRKRKLWLWIALFLVASLAYFSHAIQGIAVEEKPDETIEWRSADRGGWARWGQAGSCLYAMSVKQPVLDIWQWTGPTMKLRMQKDLGQKEPFSLTVLNDTSCVSFCCIFREEGERILAEPFLRIFDLDDKKSVREWQTERDLVCTVSRASANGTNLALWATIDGKSAKSSRKKVRVGMLGLKADRIDWITDMTYRTTSVNIGGVVPSERYNQMLCTG